MNQHPFFIRVLIFSNIMLLTIVGFFLITAFNKNDDNKRFKEITAERINIVNANGTPVMVISNKERIANPIMGGKNIRYLFLKAGNTWPECSI